MNKTDLIIQNILLMHYDYFFFNFNLNDIPFGKVMLYILHIYFFFSVAIFLFFLYFSFINSLYLCTQKKNGTIITLPSLCSNISCLTVKKISKWSHQWLQNPEQQLITYKKATSQFSYYSYSDFDWFFRCSDLKKISFCWSFWT